MISANRRLAAEVVRLKKLVNDQRRRLEALEKATPGSPSDGPTPVRARRSRREIFRLLGATAAGAAGAAVLRAIPASAANGDSLILGNTDPAVNKFNFSTYDTWYVGPAGAFNGFFLLNVDNSFATSNKSGGSFIGGLWGRAPSGGNGVEGHVIGKGSGVFGTVENPTPNVFGVTGVSGHVTNPGPTTFSAGVSGFIDGDTTNAIGVIGSTMNPSHTGAGCGVNGQADTGCGVFAGSTSGAGVYAQSISGYAGVFHSSSGPDIFAGGTGRIFQIPTVPVGPPAYIPNSFEMVRDGNGLLWLSKPGGTWEPVQPGGLGNALFTAVSTKQYTLPGSDGGTWMDIDANILKLMITPAFNCQGNFSANSDLWTSTPGINQDIAIFISGGAYGPGRVVAWKESGGFAGTFSPNAAFLETTQPLSQGITYTIKLQWKANKQTSGTIWAGAGPIPPGSTMFSPTRLAALLIVG